MFHKVVICFVVFYCFIFVRGKKDEKCECVPYYLCHNGTIDEYGRKIIDIRINECFDSVEKCCNPADIKEPAKLTKPSTRIKPKECGIRNSKGVGFRIDNPVNKEAEYGEFPWMVLVFYKQPSDDGIPVDLQHQCGGSLIHPKVVLTATHCVRADTGVLTIRVGEWDIQTKQERYPYQDREVASVVTHPDYDDETLFNDIALLFLKDPVELDEHINVICLPPPDADVDSGRCASSGWGKDVFGRKGKRQVILKKVELPLMARSSCQENLRITRLGKRFKLHESFVCAGGEPNQDTCTGDGGSPLVCPIEGAKGRYFQAGIVAWGIGCGEYHIPGVYVNIPHFREWIDEELKRKDITLGTN